MSDFNDIGSKKKKSKLAIYCISRLPIKSVVLTEPMEKNAISAVDSRWRSVLLVRKWWSGLSITAVDSRWRSLLLAADDEVDYQCQQ